MTKPSTTPREYTSGVPCLVLCVVLPHTCSHTPTKYLLQCFIYVYIRRSCDRVPYVIVSKVLLLLFLEVFIVTINAVPG